MPFLTSHVNEQAGLQRAGVFCASMHDVLLYVEMQRLGLVQDSRRQSSMIEWKQRTPSGDPFF